MKNNLYFNKECIGKERTWIEIDSLAFHNNINQLRKVIGDSTDLGIVVKANAYGHGLELIGTLCQENDYVSWLFTSDVKEAIRLRESGVTKKILVLGYSGDALDAFIDYDIACAASDMHTATMFSKHASKRDKKIALHLKIDTGMSRYGFIPQKDGDTFFIDDIIDMVKLDNVEINGIFTHLADTNAVDYSFTHKQLQLFDASVSYVEHIVGKKLYTHALASGGLHLAHRYDAVRVGTNAYGYWKSFLQRQRIIDICPHTELNPILTWKTAISHIKYIQQGDTVGYQRTFTAPKRMKIAILPVGYYDGYPRALSGKGYVRVAGVNAPILGNISMNSMVIDITDIDDIKIDDEVILCGNFVGVAANDLAFLSNSIPNEFLARICPLIIRTIR